MHFNNIMLVTNSFAIITSDSVTNNNSDSVTKKLFALRKENKLVEALNLLLENLPQGFPATNKLTLSNDKWLTLAALYVIGDLLKFETAQNNRDEIKIEYLLNLLSGLDVSNEPKNQAYLSRIKALANKYFYLIEQYNKIPKKEDNKKAIELLSEYRSKANDNSYDLSLAWRIYYYISESLKEVRFNTYQIKKYLNLYFHLQIKDQPHLNTCILIVAKQLKKKLYENKAGNDFKFYSFAKIWGFENLTRDDWSQNDPKFKSLAEDVITIVAKELSDIKEVPNEFLEYFLPYINKLIDHGTDNLWINLYLSRILQKNNKIEEAKNSLIKVLKEKKTESWVWNELGMLLENEDKQLAISCYCKALLCRTDENFKVNIHKNLGILLEKLGKLADAKTEYLRYYEIKGSEKDLDKPHWFEQIKEIKNHDDFYKLHSNLAEEILFNNLKNIAAIVGSETTYFDKNKKKDVKKTLLYANIKGNFSFPNISNESIPLEVKVGKNMLSPEMIKGTNIVIKGEVESNKLNILRIEQSSLSKDLKIKPQIGVISAIYEKNEFFIVTVDKGCVVKVDLSKLKKKKFNIGIGVGVKLTICYRYDKESKPCYSVIDVIEDVQNNEIPNYLLKTFDGPISINESSGFGFVNNIFIPQKIINNSLIEDGDSVTGTACINFNKKKNSWGYSAIKIVKY
mgnify:FL=1